MLGSNGTPPRMAFLLSNNSNSLLSRLRSTQHRQQQQLLEEDPALKRFKSYKKSVWRLKRMGDVLTIVVFAGCCYEIYVRTFLKKAAAETAKGSGNQA